MARNPSTVARRTVGGNSLNRPGDQLRSVETSGQAPTLRRAVVLEVFDNPSSLTEDQKQALAEQVSNPELVDILPINSVLARVVSDSQDHGNPTSTILLPFFSSNILMPVVPGEHVYVIYADPSRNGTTIGYWLSRVSEQRTVEDVNYTVHDRRFFPEYNPQLMSTTERGRDQDHTPAFPNGADTPQTLTLRVTGSNNENPYDGIVNTSVAIRNFSFEPVPRYNKRVGEMVLQGKNNSMIVLGEDRTGPVVRARADAMNQAGSLDLVAGRARKLPENENVEPQDTAPRIIENTRHKNEVNKTPYLQEGRQDNPREGDPDLMNDAARVLISMQSEADKNFGLTNISFPSDTLDFSQPNEGVSGSLGKSYVVGKADNIRIIARKNDQVDGTLLVIREGTSEDNLAYFYINSEGKIQIYGPEIYMGKSTGKAEPYIKWSEYKNSVQNLQDQINSLKDFCNQLSQTLQTAFSTAIAVPYSQVASLNAVANVIPQLYNTGPNTTIPEKEASLLNNGDEAIVEKAKSQRIFGE